MDLPEHKHEDRQTASVLFLLFRFDRNSFWQLAQWVRKYKYEALRGCQARGETLDGIKILPLALLSQLRRYFRVATVLPSKYL